MYTYIYICWTAGFGTTSDPSKEVSSSDCELTREPIPVWNLVRVVRSNPDADLVRQTTTLMGSDEDISINMPSAPMPMPEGDATALMHPALVTHLTGSKPYYMKGGLIPHLTKKGYFWKSTPPAIHVTVLKYRLRIDPILSAHLDQVDKIKCGWTAPLLKLYHCDATTGLHHSLGLDCALKNAQYWVKQDGTTSKATSLAIPPMSWNNSVQGLTPHFEQMTMRHAVNPMDLRSLLDEPTAEAAQIQVNHEVSVEYYSGHIFAAIEMFPIVDRPWHQAANACHRIPIQLDSEPRDCLLCSSHRQTKEEAVLLTILLEEVCDRDNV